MPPKPLRVSPDHRQPARRVERPEYDPMLDIRHICNINIGSAVSPTIPGLSIRMLPPPFFLNEGREKCPCYEKCPNLQQALGLALQRVLGSGAERIEIILQCPFQQRSQGTCEATVSLSATN